MSGQRRNRSPRGQGRMASRARTVAATASLMLAAIVACSDAAGPDEHSPVGTWNLVAMNGQDLPVLLDTLTDEECPVLVHFESALLDIRADGSWDSSTTITARCEATDKIATITPTATGAWETFEGGVRLTHSSSGATSEATLRSRDVMEVDDSQHDDPYLRGVFRFHRATNGEDP